jgi:hypothetical protein
MAQGDPQANTAEINELEQPTPTEEDEDQQWVDERRRSKSVRNY